MTTSSEPRSGAWTTACLGDLGQLHCGQSPSSSEVNHDGRGVPYVSGPEQWDGFQLGLDKWTTNPKRIAPERSIFITVKGAGVGTIFPGDEAAIGRDIYAYEPTGLLDRGFVLEAIRYTVQDLIRNAVGDIPGLSKSHILDHSVQLPPLPEQRRIVEAIESYLTRLDDAVATLERVQRNLKRYRASLLKAAVEGRLVPTEAELARAEGRGYEPASALLERVLAGRRRRWEEAELARMKAKGKPPENDTWRGKYVEPAPPDIEALPELPEGWHWSSVGELFDVRVGATPSRAKPEYWNGGVPWVSSGEVSFCRIGKTRETISEVGLRNCSTQLNPAGTVLLGMIGEGKTRGQAAILGLAACSNQNSAAIRVSATDLPPEYVYYFLMGQYEVTRTRGSGNNQPALSKTRVEAIPIPLPPLAEARRIVAQIENRESVHESLDRSARASKGRIARLRQSILKWAFEGRLVDQDPSDEPASQLLERIRAERESRPAQPARTPRRKRATAEDRT